ncbi:MAG: spondin domain-containing protein, partial [Myxococcota bacterium]
ATMFVQSNDVFIGPDEAGIPLFDAAGAPISGDITDQVVLWDVGSEANEAPGSGPNQAPRQSGPDIGGAEGAIRLHTAPTHALPAPAAFVGIEVAEAAGEYTFTVTNTAPNSGTLLTPFADVVWALHSTDIEFFTVGGSASPGLEILAEDGGGMAWADELNGVDGVTAGVASSGGPVMGGDSAPAITVTPTMDAPQFSLAAMVVQTNDAFWSTPAVGVALLDEAGAPRPAADIQAEIASVLRIYDAGTEVDEVPGVGVNQAPRQGPPNTGEDEDGEVRRYDGSTGTTNALADLATTGLISVTVETIEGAFVVRVQSNGAGFPGLTPVAWALHSQEVNFFEAGGTATPGLESLAEDGAVDTIVGELAGVEEVDQSGVQAIPDGGSDPAPAMPGGGYTFSVAPTMDGRFLSLASMVIPSNDLFLALGPGGVALLEADGTRRSDEDINADIAAALAVWDAGTEQNQAGAAGSMQARPPFFGGPGGQGGPNMGEAEGNGLVREIPDGVWVYPTAGQVVRITVTPAE